MTHKAKKVVIITEKLITNGVIEIINESGAVGYTVHSTGGKGSRGIRSEDRTRLVEAFANIQIDVIATEEVAHTIAQKVADKYFARHSGITYLEDVEVLRPGKFSQTK
ncbi:MAG: hypothetical protein AAF658_05490 [Myxococcota bacterium]